MVPMLKLIPAKINSAMVPGSRTSSMGPMAIIAIHPMNRYSAVENLSNRPVKNSLNITPNNARLQATPSIHQPTELRSPVRQNGV